MITIDAHSSVPIYEQVKTELRGMVARGLLKPGDQVPAIRTLSQTLLVNPNTIARAYRELVMEGFLETRRGEGNYVSAAARELVHDGLDSTRRQLLDAILVSRRGGLSWKDIQLILQKAKGEES
ncbi:MAG: GntR family transcriptional regulator [Acidobacteria bacterium]|nr:MAG: GntR family transcriptional regulator [Acidobacteriota bacterium]